MSSDRRDDRKDREFRSRPNDTNRNDSKSIRCRVFVGNLATEELSRQEFEDIFIKHGRVIGCSVHNGYGFVQYEKESSADMAVAKEHGTTIKGKRVDVNLAGDRRKPDTKRRPPPPAGRGGGRPGDRAREHSPSPKAGRHDDPFSIPGYREARDRYRDEHSDSDRTSEPSYGRGHDEVPAKKLRPDYDFAPLSGDRVPPPIGKPVEAPIDCEIIIINKQQMVYAESVEKKLKLHGLVVECAHLPETVPLLDELDDASKRGVLFGIIISSQHEVHRSVTVHILHGTQQGYVTECVPKMFRCISDVSHVTSKLKNGGLLKKKDVKKMTSSQRSAGSVRVASGHVLVNERYQGSVLVKVLKGSVDVVFENLGFMDFRPSGDVGVLFLNEAELIRGTNYKQRIIKLAKIQTIRGLVLYEKTAMTVQYCEQLQKFTSMNVGLNLYSVSSQEEVAKFLIQMVSLSNNPRSNPFVIKKSQKPIDEALFSTLQTVPGLGEKKAIALLQRFGSLKGLSEASKQDISNVVGDAAAQTVKSFFCFPPK